MAVYTNANRWSKEFVTRVNGHSPYVRALHESMARSVFAFAQSNLTGGTSSAELAAAGHPFARGGGRTMAKGGFRVTQFGGAFPLLPINKQSGNLYSSGELERQISSSGQTFLLAYSAPYAKFILNDTGTRNMVGRSFTRTVNMFAARAQADFIKRVPNYWLATA